LGGGDHASNPEKLFRDSMDVVNSHRPDALDRFQDYLSDDLSFSNPVTGPTDKDGMGNFHRSFLKAFPDYHYALERIIPHGNTLVAEYTFKGSHQSELMGIPATKKHVALPLAFIVDFEGDKIKRWQSYFDTGSLMRQLGVLK
jgi:steroid delta-isomerase-like uncharacterized protein